MNLNLKDSHLVFIDWISYCLSPNYLCFKRASKLLLSKWSELDTRTKCVILKDIKQYVNTCSLKYETLDNLGKDSFKHWDKILLKLEKLEGLLD